MPWNATRFPPAMANLPEPVRAKALEIANALLDDGNDKGRSIRIAIAQAKRWAQRPRRRSASRETAYRA